MVLASFKNGVNWETINKIKILILFMTIKKFNWIVDFATDLQILSLLKYLLIYSIRYFKLIHWNHLISNV